ncbi:hypothetical protein HRI_003347000 [Hibiscus trionum]|uniref:Uncharacterized protein n=1 Tax=Hibiscus trionum TaxID=183268 RepID=A0A9W7IHI3_HIBTR|nr:hypothetical protein HRI_003347000 [Hibiscus trionum]
MSPMVSSSSLALHLQSTVQLSIPLSTLYLLSLVFPGHLPRSRADPVDPIKSLTWVESSTRPKPFMVLIIAILNDGTIMTISKDRVKPSPLPDSWKLKEIFATEIVLGGYLALMTVVFLWVMYDTDFFTDKFGVRSLRDREGQMMGDLYLQVSIVSQALIFVTRSRSWSFMASRIATGHCLHYCTDGGYFDCCIC